MTTPSSPRPRPLRLPRTSTPARRAAPRRHRRARVRLARRDHQHPAGLHARPERRLRRGRHLPHRPPRPEHLRHRGVRPRCTVPADVRQRLLRPTESGRAARGPGVGQLRHDRRGPHPADLRSRRRPAPRAARRHRRDHRHARAGHAGLAVRDGGVPGERPADVRCRPGLRHRRRPRRSAARVVPPVVADRRRRRRR